MQDVFTMARENASIPPEPGRSTESTNNVDRMTNASLVVRRKRTNSDISVDGLALLASTAIAEWDQNGQHNHQRKMLELSETSIAPRDHQWLEKHNQSEECCQKHARAPMSHSNSSDESLVLWVTTLRRGCEIKSRSKPLNAVGFA